jgi:hypothetical protein
MRATNFHIAFSTLQGFGLVGFDKPLTAKKLPAGR